MLLPHVKAINDEHIAEKETKAKILGLEFEEVNPQAVDCFSADRLYCDICKTSYSSDICLACCLEIRNGKLQACQEDVSWNYINRGLEYVHGEKGEVVETTNNKLNSEDRMKLISMWKAKEAGSISCYCGAGELELKRILPNDWLSDLFKKVEKAAEANKLSILPKMAMKQCPCFNSQGHIDNANYKRLKAACREGAEDNYLYSPSVRDVQQDDLKHFQHHWVKGEPVVMRNVLEVTPGLSWEPMVMWRIYRQLATPSMDYVEKLMLLIVWTSVRDQFILMNSESFKENLPRHWKEFLCSLPLKQYSHPGCGPLNLAVKLLEAKHGAKDVHCLWI